MSFPTYLSNSKYCSKTWILDSGATSHICHTLSSFSCFTYLSNSFVTLTNSNKVPVTAIVTFSLSPNFTLTNVLYIPTFHVNLISVRSSLRDTNLSVLLYDTYFLIRDNKMKREIGKGNLCQGLYLYEVTYCTFTTNKAHTSQQDTVPNVLLSIQTMYTYGTLDYVTSQIKF